MTYYREVPFHEIPDAYARQTLARAEEVYGREEIDPEVLEYWDQQEEDIAREDWQNERALVLDRFVDESDVLNPDVTQILAVNGHVYHYSPARDE